MEILQPVLVLTTLLCSLVAGFVLAFAVVVMPGVGALEDREFIRAFQVMDGIIQRNQPIFVFVWLGSIVAVLASLLLGLLHLGGWARSVLVFACLAYLLVVQLPTFLVNVPLNNALQALDLAAADDASLIRARSDFEPRWNRWNSIRTAFATLASLLLMVLLLRI